MRREQEQKVSLSQPMHTDGATHSQTVRSEWDRVDAQSTTIYLALIKGVLFWPVKYQILSRKGKSIFAWDYNTIRHPEGHLSATFPTPFYLASNSR